MADEEDAGGTEGLHTSEILALPQEEVDRLQTEPPLRPYLVQKTQKETGRSWDLFYRRNTTNFFKDRHWLTREFPLLLRAAIDEEQAAAAPGSSDPHVVTGHSNTQPDVHAPQVPSELPPATAAAESAQSTRADHVATIHSPPAASHRPVLLELGCGVGNAIFPLRRENPALFVYACDISPRAVEFVKNHAEYAEEHCCAFQCDLTQLGALEAHIPAGSCDMVTNFFMLSAVGPSEWDTVLGNVAQVLRLGGRVFFRDYAIYDYAMVRFKPGHKLADRFYVRTDGTRAYYFTLEELSQLFERHGFTVENLEYIHRQTVNVKAGLDVPRIFAQGTFRKVCDR